MSEQAARELESKLSNYGLDFRPTSERLEELNRVENTYLSFFRAWGLGSSSGNRGFGGCGCPKPHGEGRGSTPDGSLGLRACRQLTFLALKEHLQLGSVGSGVGSVSAVVGIARKHFGGAGECQVRNLFGSFF